MKFKIGQEVVCIHSGPWIGTKHGTLPYCKMPKFNEIVTISDVLYGGTDVLLYEYPLNHGDSFRASLFAPIISDSELKEELSNVYCLDEK